MTPEEIAAKMPKRTKELMLEALRKNLERELGPGHIVTVERVEKDSDQEEDE